MSERDRPRGQAPTSQGLSRLPLQLGSAATAAAAKSLKSHLTLGDPIDGSPPGSPGPGILQARTLEWVSSAYLRLLIFLLAILIPACASSSPVFLMMYSAYKLNKQGDNIQP